MDSVSFQTKARTIDHLGREQIADTPTAISELWKNAFDAYARNAHLHIYDGVAPVAAVVDDGHGMSRDEFVERWLVVGTEAKSTSAVAPIQDRLGLPVRTRQGQKGIGRLSCANLGPIMCLVSKRENSSFVAALIDWRMFENPFLNLADIEVPVVEFDHKGGFTALLPRMVEQLKENITGGGNKARAERLKAAWTAFDQQQSDGGSKNDALTSKGILKIDANNLYSVRHLMSWPVWDGSSNHGTVMLISQINFDLTAHLASQPSDSAAQGAKDRFFETLSSFVDPFAKSDGAQQESVVPEFSYSVRVWTGDQSRLVVGSGKEIESSIIQQIEHQLVGQIDENGVFHGRAKAFGEWIDELCEIAPPEETEIPARADAKTGRVEIFFSSIELDRSNSVHDTQEFERFRDLADKYSGLLVFRDGLRVLPFGRSDSDFFEVDLRSSKNSGREFWSHRSMFGRIAITRDGNPNLKDKAGREGLLDNRAAKTLKALVSNILKVSARRYFGSASQLRKDLLPEIRTSNKKQKAAESRAAKRRSNRKKFKDRLDKFSKEVPPFHDEVVDYLASLRIENDRELANALERRDEISERLVQFRLPGAPETLGTLEEKYNQFRVKAANTQACLSSIDAIIHQAVEEIGPASPVDLLEKQLARNAAQIHRRIRSWKAEIEALQRTEYERIRELVDTRNKVFHAEARPILHRLESQEIEFSAASELMEMLRDKVDTENADLFIPYIGALESLKESIDLEHLANFGMEELSDLRAEIDRLNALAQLGIAVEINGHELQSYDEIIGAAISKLPAEVANSKAGQDLIFGFEGLTDQLRFLSPLRLSGPRVSKWVTGQDIFDYVHGFFSVGLARHRIKLTASPEFLRSSVFDQPSRLFPVFINLINNSQYWLSVTRIDDKAIVLDILDGEVIVSDNGPGVAEEDEPNLFNLFFTKKARGGRGVGLYLSKANLSAGGHKIRYVRPTEETPLSGANFLIRFRGLRSDAS